MRQISNNKNILLVDDERAFLLAAKEGIEHLADHFKVLTAFDGKQAAEILDTDRVDLVVTDLMMPEMDGFGLIAHMSKSHWDIPILVMTAFGTPEIQGRLQQLGTFPFIEKPVGINDLVNNILEAFSDASKSCIHGFSLGNFLQIIEMEEKTVSLRIRFNQKIGYLHIHSGVLIDAETGALHGKEAAIEIIGWDQTEIEILNGVSKKSGEINDSLMHIIMEATKSMDEKRADGTFFSDDELVQAIGLAESGYPRQSRDLLLRYLKENPRSHKGWLWLSRVSEKLKIIEIALKNATKVSSYDPEVIEEISKFNFTRKHIEEGQFQRCPFCWAPVGKKAIQCHYCRGHLYIHPQIFTSDRSANYKILSGAIDRYAKIIEREPNINAHYYLAMAHLNLKQWEESLKWLDKIVKLNANNQFFSDQLEILLNHMASTGVISSQEMPPEKAVEDSSSVVDEIYTTKVLVVEDSSTTRKVISVTLEQNGYETIEARDGLEALSRLNENKPDLILLDIILPKMDGYKILSIIKDSPEHKNIPVIMLTSKDRFMDKVKGKVSGSAAYLTKPFDPKQLVETIEKHL